MNTISNREFVNLVNMNNQSEKNFKYILNKNDENKQNFFHIMNIKKYHRKLLNGKDSFYDKKCNSQYSEFELNNSSCTSGTGDFPTLPDNSQILFLIDSFIHKKKFIPYFVSHDSHSTNPENNFYHEKLNREHEIKFDIKKYEKPIDISSHKITYFIENNTNGLNIKNFKCTVKNCNKEYKSKENLKLHYKNIHLKQKPYKCQYCIAFFSHRNGKNKIYLFLLIRTYKF